MISCKVNKNKVKHAELFDVLLPYLEGTVGRLLMSIYFSNVERLRLFFPSHSLPVFFSSHVWITISIFGTFSLSSRTILFLAFF